MHCNSFHLHVYLQWAQSVYCWSFEHNKASTSCSVALIPIQHSHTTLHYKYQMSSVRVSCLWKTTMHCSVQLGSKWLPFTVTLTNYIHFTQYRRVCYSQKQIGFRSSITCTFKNNKLEIGNVCANRGLWICHPRIHTRIFVKELDILIF